MQHPTTQAIAAKFVILRPLLDEHARRLWAAVEARAIGRGGSSCVAEATGRSRVTIRAGVQALVLPGPAPSPRATQERLRRPGGGRKPRGMRDPHLLHALETVVDPVPRGDPRSLLRWTGTRAAQFAAALHAQGHLVSARTVNRRLHDLGSRLQANRQTLAGRAPPDREAPFHDINRQAKACQQQGQPVMSGDTTKTELIGHFRTGGRDGHPQGQPAAVQGHDVPDQAVGQVRPDGVYDDAPHTGWVSVGVDHDTAALAVATVRRWWRHLGRQTYPRAKRFLLTADGGGSNGSRCRLGKVALQRLAEETGRRISVCHLPPGTSQWNTIEPRMFCHMTEKWRGRPVVSREVVVHVIGHTTTKTGVASRSALDEHRSPTGREVTAQPLESLAIQQEKFHGEWNDTIQARP